MLEIKKEIGDERKKGGGREGGGGGLHSCTRILGKQWFLWDIPSVAGIVGRYVYEVANPVLKYPKWIKVCFYS